MAIALLIANLHVAVFYVFFIFFLPYIAEYLIIRIREAHLIHKIYVHDLNDKIRRLSKKQGKEEKIKKLEEKLKKSDETFARFNEVQDRREKNPYKIKLVKRDAAKWLILIAVLCFAMGLLTPIGDEPYTHIFKLMAGNTTDSISEHQPLVLFGNNEAILVLVFILGILMFTDIKITLKDFFMLGGLIFLTFMSRRQMSLLVIVGVMSFTKLVADFIDKYDKDGTEEFSKLMLTWKGEILTIVIIVLVSYCYFKPKMDDEYIQKDTYPVDASNFILEEAEKGNIDLSTMKIFNDYNYGSYLLFRGIPVFIDSRADLYSPEFNEGCDIFSDYLDIANISTWYEDKFNEYGITHVITYQGAKLNLLLPRDENYKEIYSDDYFVLYERVKVDTRSNEER